MFAENVPFNSGTIMEISRGGEILSTKAPCPPYCVAPCYGQMVRMAEQVASYAKTDFLRVDILVQGDCEELYVSEAPGRLIYRFVSDFENARWWREMSISYLYII